MSRKSWLLVVTSAAAVCAAFVGVFVLRDARSRERTAPPAESAAAVQPPAEPAVAARLPAPIASAAPSTLTTAPRDSVLLGERDLMDTLRELRGSNPVLTLQLARDGNERFTNSADAAERCWFIVKSLSDLGRHDEARLEGRRLVEKYRGTRWAEDVYRHLFVNPPTHPFERGYGKVLESDP